MKSIKVYISSKFNNWYLLLILLIDLLLIFVFRLYQPFCEPCLSVDNCPPCISSKQYLIINIGLILKLGTLFIILVKRLTKNEAPIGSTS